VMACEVPLVYRCYLINGTPTDVSILLGFTAGS
jgi:hypothetical protein